MIVKIAVSYEDGKVFQHFGHSKQFKIYETDHNEIISSLILETNGHGHSDMANFLKENHVNIVLCGGIGDGAKKALSSCGIHSFGGVTVDADEVVQKYLAGTLELTTRVTCTKDKDSHMCKGHCH